MSRIPSIDLMERSWGPYTAEGMDAQRPAPVLTVVTERRMSDFDRALAAGDWMDSAKDEF